MKSLNKKYTDEILDAVPIWAREKMTRVALQEFVNYVSAALHSYSDQIKLQEKPEP